MIGAVVAGCAGDEPAAPREATQEQDITGYIGQQGRLLLGFVAPDVRNFSFPAVPGTVVDGNGRLSNGTIGGTQYKGAPITATGLNASIKMRIAEVIPPVPPATQWQYVLEQLDPASGAWSPACDDPQLVLPSLLPVDKPVRAIAMPGRMLADGTYLVSPNSVLFSCKTGVVAKCDAWGYSVSNPPPSGTVSAYDLMQACSRMARADYCGSGGPSTLDGTPIHIDDAFHPQSVVSGYAFEAAWPGKASVRAPSNQPVVCLSKLRWSTLPLGGNCPLQVPDPRVNAKARFCDDLSINDMVARGALTFSSSSYIDAGLSTFVDPATDLHLTTSQLWWLGALGAQWQSAPPAGMPFPVAGQAPPTFEATILAPKLPPGFSDPGLRALTSYQCATDMITSVTPPGDPSCTPIAFEGWLYPSGTPSTTPLRRWFNPATKHSWTTATSPAVMIINHWQQAETLGNAVRAKLDVRVWSSAFVTTPATTIALDIELRSGEWIPSCLTGIASFVATYTGTCADGRAVNHADIIAFRVVTSGGAQSAPIAYDGVASDVVAPIAGGTPTAVEIDWNDVGNAVYAVDVLPFGGVWTRCADTNLVASDTSYLHDGLCATPNTFVRPATTNQVRVCAFDRTTGAALPCATAAYTWNADKIHVALSR
ncbi:MAG TPA: ADYC domain-containing protein [Kofleriaceae bacterium]|nr:ADYC domain-containing protein [Kofleriaceae bacterium]